MMKTGTRGAGKFLRWVLLFLTVLLLTACGGGGSAGSSGENTGGGNAGPPASGAAITPAAVASRTSGVAPLSVFFDASGTTATSTTEPFHDLQYTWDFGDPAGSPVSGTTWATGARPGKESRNAATGPLAGHVYENPGTFTPKVTISDGSHSVTYTLAPITVGDPDSVFAGGATTCVAAKSTPVAGAGGCPSGASVINLSALADPTFNGAITAALVNGNRILFKRGDTFPATSTTTIVTQGPGLIGAYGQGAAPLICSNYTCSPQAGASFTGSISGTTLTVSGVTGTIAVGQAVVDTGGKVIQGTNNTMITAGSGDTWTVDRSQNVAATSMWSGFDGSPLIFGDMYHPTVNNCAYPPHCSGGQLADWRVMDLDFLGNNTSLTGAVGMGGAFNELTLLRLTANKERAAFGNGVQALDLMNNSGFGDHAIWDQLTVQDCTITDPESGVPGNTPTYSIGAYLGGDRMFFAGNNFDLHGSATVGTSHVTRFTYLGKAVISENTLAHPGPTEQCIKLMAPAFPGGQGDSNDYSACPPNGAGCPKVAVAGLGGGYSRWIEINDNDFVAARNNYLVAIAPQDGWSDERIRDVIVEGNLFEAGSTDTVATGLFLDGFDYTVRNNIFNLGPSPGAAFLFQPSPGSRPVHPSGLDAYNNSWYESYAAGNDVHFAKIDTTATDVTLKNNLAYAPYGGNGTSFAYICQYEKPAACFVYDGTNFSQVTAANNSTLAQMLDATSPFRVDSPATPADFTPAAGSYAIGAGDSTVPVWNDFFGHSRSAPYDLGAVNH